MKERFHLFVRRHKHQIVAGIVFLALLPSVYVERQILKGKLTEQFVQFKASKMFTIPK